MLVQNAIASTSRNTTDQLDVWANNRPSLPSSPKRPSSLSTRAHEKSPILSMKQMPPTSGPSSVSSSAKSSNDQRISPPPDPKALAYIPVGPTSNPLGIRPSLNPSALRRLPHKPPIGPKALTQPALKKRVIVGTGWSAARGSTSSNSSAPLTSVTSNPSVSSSSSVPLQPPSAPTHPAKAVDLSHIVSYTSPSPPPPPPSQVPPSAPSTKWKRLVEGRGTSGHTLGTPPCIPPPPLRTGSLSSFVSASQSPLTPSTPVSPCLPSPISSNDHHRIDRSSTTRRRNPVQQVVQGKSSLPAPSRAGEFISTYKKLSLQRVHMPITCSQLECFNSLSRTKYHSRRGQSTSTLICILARNTVAV